MSESNFKTLQIKKFPQKAYRDTPENKFWKKFDVSYQETHKQVIKSVHSGANDRNLISFTDGKSVQIFDCQRQKIIQSINNFKAGVNSVCLRKDGMLIATGQNDGIVQVYDVKRKNKLRVFENHKKAVHALHFTDQDNNLFTGSDDLNLKLFDVAGGIIIRTLPKAHTDFIRSIQTLPNSSNNVLSSSYDFKINQFDFNAKTNKPTQVFDHGHPVEDISILSSGFQFVSVGGTYTNIWDIRMGKLLESQNNNQKTVTSVQYLSTGDRFITGGLDCHIKIYRTDTFSVTHQFKYPNPVMAFDFSKDTQHFAAGMSEGTVIIKSNKRKLGEEEKDEEEEQDDDDELMEKAFIPDFLKGGNQIENHHERLNSYKYYNRGIYTKADKYDLKFEDKKKKKLSNFDKFLKKFQYRECFMTAFKQNQADIILSLYEEYLQRGCLKHSLSNLEEDELDYVLSFIEKKIINPKFSDMCIEITDIITQLYQFEAEERLENIGKIIENEISIEKNLLALEGPLETIINTNLLQ